MEDNIDKNMGKCIYSSFAEFVTAYKEGQNPTNTNEEKLCLENNQRNDLTVMVYDNNCKSQRPSNMQIHDKYLDHKISCNNLNWNQVIKYNLNIETIMMYPDPDERKRIFNELEKQVNYLTEPTLTKIKINGKLHSIPRKQAAYGDSYCNGIAITYTYSGIKLTPMPWTDTPILHQILLCLNKITGYVYNFVLVNRYKDGNDKMGYHKDDEKEIDENIPIASLSFGQERVFSLKHQKIAFSKSYTREDLRYNMILKDGMLLLMNPPTNQFWYHGIMRQSLKSCPNPRINLTFRKILTKR